MLESEITRLKAQRQAEREQRKIEYLAKKDQLVPVFVSPPPRFKEDEVGSSKPLEVTPRNTWLEQNAHQLDFSENSER